MSSLLTPAAAAIVIALAALPGQAQAATLEGAALAQARNCMGCHQVDTKRVGPPFASVAERYQGLAGAPDLLVASIRKGSMRKWGAIPMPAQTQVNEADARELARWVLSLKP